MQKATLTSVQFVYHCIHAITMDPKFHHPNNRSFTPPPSAVGSVLSRHPWWSCAAAPARSLRAPCWVARGPPEWPARESVLPRMLGWLAIGPIGMLEQEKPSGDASMFFYCVVCSVEWRTKADVRLVISVPLVECRQKACTHTWDGANHSAPLWGQPSDCWSSHCVQTSAEKPNKSERSHVS